ncbi:peptide/nickel transport system permease protein [Pseudacidovorax intermedius]|uniref:Peptide/nickel transport system permease protein n=1 Tax=Pseudacidovorax intermedius TaxID=433924 RepID=A0A370FBV6_9BURK|nr:ABC transporter permease [Pseudacidovorax intermedius]RDI22726.1 peptide/nickel transport system permease protein [Pseudacidovorax intermedius]
MWRIVFSRLAAGLLVAWGSTTAAFIALHALPGEVQDILAGDMDYPGLREAIAAEWGLDRSMGAQYLAFVGRIVQGDFGTSYALRQPVAGLVASQVGPTVELALAAGLIALVLAVLVGSLTAGPGRLGRRIAGALELTFASTPVFWLGILLLIGFSFTLPWFPVSGAEGWRSLVLPALALALPTAGLLAQVLREAMDKALEQPFVVTVRARGLGEGAVRLRHVLRHAALPLLTLGGWIIGGLLGGAVITEKVFGRPGLGTVTLNAVLSHDVPVVLAVVLLAAFVHVVASTLLDLLALLIDPRLASSP